MVINPETTTTLDLRTIGCDIVSIIGIRGLDGSILEDALVWSCMGLSTTINKSSHPTRSSRRKAMRNTGGNKLTKFMNLVL